MTDPITGLSSMATRQILSELAAAYRDRTGQDVALRAMGGVEAAARVRAGETADILVLASDAMKQLEDEGHILSGSLTPFAASGIAVAVPVGTPHPDIHDENSVRQATQTAGRLCYSTGPSGAYLRRLWDSWGLDTGDPDKFLLAPPGVPVGKLLADGKADLGFQQFSELIGLSGIEVVGSLPDSIQLTTIFTIGMGNKVENLTILRKFVAFLVSKDAEATICRHGMSLSD